MAAILLLVLPIAGSMLLVWGVFQVIMDLRTAKRKKVVDRLSESSATQRERKVKESLLRKRVNESPGNVFERLVSQFQIVNKLQKLLSQADVGWSASKTLVNLLGAAFIVGAGLMLLKIGVITCLAVSGSVIGLPLLWLLHKRQKRIKTLVLQLPDVFELMGQALQAGHSLASAIQLVSTEMPDPIGGEFARVFHDQNLGITMKESLLNMANRTDQMDVRFFVTAVLIQRETGGDLAEILDKSGRVIRDRIQLFGMVAALTAEGRLSGWVLLGLPVVVFFASLAVNPDYGSILLDTDTGRMMLGIAIVMDLMGLAMIKKIVNIKV